MFKFVFLIVSSALKISRAGEPPERNVNIVRFDLIQGEGSSKVITIFKSQEEYLNLVSILIFNIRNPLGDKESYTC